MTWKINRNFIQFALIGTLSLIVTSCGSSVKYSFTGVSVDAKSISISEFYNNADLGPANMGQTFTNSLKNYFIQNSSIPIVAEEGELQLEGEIVDLRLTPVAPVNNGSQENTMATATATRMTITVRATFINTLDETMSFKNKTFSFFKDFPSESNLTDVEEQYTREIFNRIINDIFNASIANW